MKAQKSKVKSQNYSAKGKSELKRMIADQLLRSATSIGANTVEAQAASRRKEFIKFYEIALKSANETKYWPNILGASLLTLKGKRQNS